MINEATLNMIQRAIDNEVSPEELKHLEDLCEQDEQVRHLYLSMKKMVEQLEKTEPVEPRPFLEQKIKDACSARSGAIEGVPLSGRIYQLAGSLFTTRIGVSFATGMAAGLVLFLATSSFVNFSGDVDPVGMSGSILLNDNEMVSHAAVRTVELPSATVEFTSQTEQNKVSLNVVVSADQDVAIELKYPVDQLLFEEISGFKASHSGFSSSPGEIEISGIGNYAATLLFKATAEEVGLLSYNVKCDNQLKSGSIGLVSDSH